MSPRIPEPSPAKYLLREMGAAAHEFYRRLSEDDQLFTTRCERCARTSFPPRTHCSTCSGPLIWIELPRHGRLYAFTSQEVALRFRAPAVLALAELGDVVLPGIALAPYSELRIGQEVWVQPLPEPDTGLTLLSFRTTPTP
jgi:uncharacterized OB-fold protein